MFIVSIMSVMPLAHAQTPPTEPCFRGLCFRGDLVTILPDSPQLGFRGCPTQEISDFVVFEQLMHSMAHVLEQHLPPGGDKQALLPTFDPSSGEAVFPAMSSPMMSQQARLQPILKERAGSISFNEALKHCPWSVGGHRAVVSEIPPTSSLSVKVHDLDTDQDYWIAMSAAVRRAPDSVGTIGGVKIRIPALYRHNSLVTYISNAGLAGGRTGGATVDASAPTINTPIDTVSVDVRQSDFQPVASPQEQADFGLAENTVRAPPPVENRWLHIQVSSKGYPMDPQARFEDDANSRWSHGPFEKLPDTWGLVHYRATTPLTSGIMNAQYEYFFDPRNIAGTLIVCENLMRAVTPYDVYAQCTLSFNLPSFHARALMRPVGITDKSDFANWRELEAKTSHMLNAFVVH